MTSNIIRINREQLESYIAAGRLDDIVKYLIKKHNTADYVDLQNYYEGNHDILDRRMNDDTKPNNKLVHNLCAYITDTIVGYFMGKPVAYSVAAAVQKEARAAEKLRAEKVAQQQGGQQGGQAGQGNLMQRAAAGVRRAVASVASTVTAPPPDPNELYLQALQDVFDYNDEQDLNAELAKTQSIKRHSFELLWVDEDAKVRFAEVDPQNMIYVESDEVYPRPLMAVRAYEVEDIGDCDTYWQYDVYTATEVVTFKASDRNSAAACGVNKNTITAAATASSAALTGVASGVNNVNNLAMAGASKLEEISRAPHYFKDVPVIHYPNNKELKGDFEGVKSLIDAYNLANSDTANDFEYFTDAYLLLVGYNGITDQDGEDIVANDSMSGGLSGGGVGGNSYGGVKSMKENRILLLDEGGSAEWLIKQINDQALENYKDRLRDDIHSLSKVPNLSDDKFAGQLSGVALAYKLWALEQIASMKERKFKKALQRRIELITNILNTKGAPRGAGAGVSGKGGYDWRAIDITFTRNMPQNLVEIVEIVAKLKGIVSEETLLSILPFVEDVQDELDKLAAERESYIDLDGIDGGDGDGGDGGGGAGGQNNNNSSSQTDGAAEDEEDVEDVGAE